jgi:hypothetical protein
VKRAAACRRGAPVLAAGALLLTTPGCIAEIKEERGYGAARPAPGATEETSEEKRTAPSEVRASASGSKIEVHVVEPTECREVFATADMVREVDVRRSFADPKVQQWDLAIALLTGAAAGLMAYTGSGPGPFTSPKQNQISSAAGAFEWPLIGLATIPMAFVAINAARVQGSRRIERAEPERSVGPWATCATRPLEHEDVTVSVGGKELHATTGAEGIAMVDLSAVMPGAIGSQAVVRHTGSDDVTLTLGDIPSAR